MKKLVYAAALWALAGVAPVARAQQVLTVSPNEATAGGAYPQSTPRYGPQVLDVPAGDRANNSDPLSAQQPNAAPAAPQQWLTAAQLQQMLAPIALYPDTLLAQILAASTYPAQVSAANQWLNQMQNAGQGSPTQIAAGADAQTGWDPAVKALTAFPDVLAMLANNVGWTTSLGNAYYNQPQDVMQTVQVLREQAEQAGNLQPTPQEQINNDQGYIDLAPANPDYVYVPVYNPWTVYGELIAPYPEFYFAGGLGDFWGGAAIQYSLGFPLFAFANMRWGWPGWGCNWRERGIFYHHEPYFTRSHTVADWGLPRGGPRTGSVRPQPVQDFGNRNAAMQTHGQTARGGLGNSAQAFPQSPRTQGMNAQNPRANFTGTHAAQPGFAQAGQRPFAGGQTSVFPNNQPRPGYGAFNSGSNRPAYGAGNQGTAPRPNIAYGSPSIGRAPIYSGAQSYASRAFNGYGSAIARPAPSRSFSGNNAPRSYNGGSTPHFFAGGGGSSHSFSGGGGHASAPQASHGGGGGHRR